LAELGLVPDEQPDSVAPPAATAVPAPSRDRKVRRFGPLPDPITMNSPFGWEREAAPE
jgi:hypothetical protein